ncbi:hypothetical protein [Parendozoicomonas haliclonae]|uniref:hypothetical protein n=1 Tax=Parendozoicomonas haliclonae TaxID=1960125 RepID=UPI0010557193|nr:hypothetical protein [Parendozoicomonas haliclonae]
MSADQQSAENEANLVDVVQEADASNFVSDVAHEPAPVADEFIDDFPASGEAVHPSTETSTEASTEKSSNESPGEEPLPSSTPQVKDKKKKNNPPMKVSRQNEVVANAQPSPVTISYIDLQARQTQQLFHSFLTTQLTSLQHKLLFDYLYQQLQIGQPAGAEAMLEELQGGASQENSSQLISQLAQALYYYHIYIYEPVVAHADKLTGGGDEGLIIPHILAMSQYLQSMFPKSQPYLSAMLTAPIAISLFSSNYRSDAPISRALSSSAYGAGLVLAAQASGGALKKFSTFNSFPAAMLASAYRHFQKGHYTQASIDSVLTMMNLKEKRGLIYSALAGAFLHQAQFPASNSAWAGVRDANIVLPLVLSVFLTEDWLSSVFAASVMLLNQHLLYAPQDYFLEPGMVYQNIEPYWYGLATMSLAATLTMLVHWSDMPTAEHASDSFWSVFSQTTDWMNYLVFAEDADASDEKSRLLGFMTRWYAWLFAAPELYQGESRVLTEHNYESLEDLVEARSGKKSSLTEVLSRWMAWWQGEQAVTQTVLEPISAISDNSEVIEMGEMGSDEENLEPDGIGTPD